MKILITGDLVVNNSYRIDQIDDSVLNFFSNSDYNIANLEAPVTKSSSKILKTGPNLKSEKKSTLNVVKALKLDLVTLANNHILDYEQQGVKDTIAFCNDINIQTVGAGMNLEEASKINYIDSLEGKIAIVNFAENEWTNATEVSAGANPMDIIDNANQIKEAKDNANFVFVIVHGGHEYYNLPSPRMQKQYRFYAEQGADVVVGHHTHCINGNEVYKGVPIYYSLGNFLFTNQSTYDDWYVGLVLEVQIKHGQISTTVHPVEQNKNDFSIRLLENEEKIKVLDRIDVLNRIISDKSKLQENWKSYVKSKSEVYLNYWSPLSFVRNRYLKSMLLRLKLRMINKRGIYLYLNLMRCEAHHDMSKEVIKQYINKI